MQVHFQFRSQLVLADTVFPKAIQKLLVNLPVQQLELAFVHGRWVCTHSPHDPITMSQ